MGYLLLAILGIGLGLGCCCGCSLCSTGGDFLQIDVDGSADDDNNCFLCSDFNTSYILDLVSQNSTQCCYEYVGPDEACSTDACDDCDTNPDCTQVCNDAAGNQTLCDPGQSGGDCDHHATVTMGGQCEVCPTNIDCSTPSSTAEGETCVEGSLDGDCACDCVYDAIFEEWYCDCIEDTPCTCSKTCGPLRVVASLCLNVDESNDLFILGEIAGPSGITYGINTTVTGSGNPADCLAAINGLDLYADATVGNESVGFNLCTRFTSITITAV